MCARRLIGWTALIAGAILLACCVRPAGGELGARAIERLSKRTFPPGAAYVQYPAAARGEWSTEASWELETRMDWHSYRDWVHRQLEEYDARAERENGLVLTRSLPGDTYQLRIEVASVGPPLHVRVRFLAYPD